MLTLRARAEKLGRAKPVLRPAHSMTTIRPTSASFSVRSISKRVTYLEPEGFSRRGLYGFTVPDSVKDHVIIEAGLSGVGRLEIADLNFFNVSTLQGAYTGRRMVSPQDYAAGARCPAHDPSRAARESLFSGGGNSFSC